MFSIIQPLFLQKTKHLNPHPKDPHPVPQKPFFRVLGPSNIKSIPTSHQSSSCLYTATTMAGTSNFGPKNIRCFCLLITKNLI